MTINVYVSMGSTEVYTEDSAREYIKENWYNDICEEFLERYPAAGIIDGLFYNDDSNLPTQERFEEYLNNRIEDYLENEFYMRSIEININ